MKFDLAIGLIIGLALSHVEANCPDECPETEEVVWALGRNCFVFRNKCFFNMENCHRRPALIVTTKEKCQRKCSSICPAIFQPVLGRYNGQIRHFSNACEMAAHSCQTGKTFLN